MLQRNKKKVYVWFESGLNLKNGNRKIRVRLIWSEETISQLETEAELIDRIRLKRQRTRIWIESDGIVKKQHRFQTGRRLGQGQGEFEPAPPLVTNALFWVKAQGLPIFRRERGRAWMQRRPLELAQLQNESFLSQSFLLDGVSEPPKAGRRLPRRTL